MAPASGRRSSQPLVELEPVPVDELVPSVSPNPVEVPGPA